MHWVCWGLTPLTLSLLVLSNYCHTAANRWKPGRGGKPCLRWRGREIKGNKAHLGTKSSIWKRWIPTQSGRGTWWGREAWSCLRQFSAFPPSWPPSYPSQAALCLVCSAPNTRAEMEWGETEEPWTWVKRPGWVLASLLMGWPWISCITILACNLFNPKTGLVRPALSILWEYWEDWVS